MFLFISILPQSICSQINTQNVFPVWDLWNTSSVKQDAEFILLDRVCFVFFFVELMLLCGQRLMFVSIFPQAISNEFDFDELVTMY